MTTTEKAASQEHVIDLCRMLGEPTPHEADPTGEHYAFEKRVARAAGGDGFAEIAQSLRSRGLDKGTRLTVRGAMVYGAYHSYNWRGRWRSRSASARRARISPSS